MNQALHKFDQIIVEEPYPHFIKYMGSKTKIMSFVLEGLNEVYRGGVVCDLFAGSASLAGAIGHQVPVHSNDIQNYSAVLADTYLNAYSYPGIPTSSELLEQAARIVSKNSKSLEVLFDFTSIKSLKQFNEIEKAQQALLDRQFRREWHLFLKCYSGTWWSAEQCLWIDALRQVADSYKEKPCYPLIISCLMYAMAYTSQGTGHYAQYRDAGTKSSMDDILIYRRRSLATYFKRKYDAVSANIPNSPPTLKHRITALDYMDCLGELSGGTVYADPPYCFVHYSRFYHALETLVLYDYPTLQIKNGHVVKGRYRETRHQSPFCIRSQVTDTFRKLFSGIKKSGANLVLSYSNTGMISIDEVTTLAGEYFGNRKTELILTDHQHMTLGRQFDRHREVKECLLLVK